MLLCISQIKRTPIPIEHPEVEGKSTRTHTHTHPHWCTRTAQLIAGRFLSVIANRMWRKVCARKTMHESNRKLCLRHLHTHTHTNKHRTELSIHLLHTEADTSPRRRPVPRGPITSSLHVAIAAATTHTHIRIYLDAQTHTRAHTQRLICAEEGVRAHAIGCDLHCAIDEEHTTTTTTTATDNVTAPRRLVCADCYVSRMCKRF